MAVVVVSFMRMRAVVLLLLLLSPRDGVMQGRGRRSRR